MRVLTPPFRPAAPGDAGALAELVNMAGDGLPLHLWGRMAKAGEDAWGVGRQRAQRESGSFSYRNAVILEEAGRPAACLIGYRLPDAPTPIDPAMPKMFVPMQELENEAAGTWYVNVVAAYPEHRGRGLGSRLLQLAEDLARETAARGLSIIVSDANAGARRLYGRHGYAEVGRRTAVKEDWRNPVEDWLLLVKLL
jgi:ribosomal protein S18 acetylase RimI-like enzyme